MVMAIFNKVQWSYLHLLKILRQGKLLPKGKWVGGGSLEAYFWHRWKVINLSVLDIGKLYGTSNSM